MIGKSVSFVNQVLGMLVDDELDVADSLTKEQYSNYYFQFRVY